jgi:hypothetical protein
VLYPLGVSSELTMAWLALPDIAKRGLFSVAMPNAWNFGFNYYTVCILVMLTYIPGAALFANTFASCTAAAAVCVLNTYIPLGGRCGPLHCCCCCCCCICLLFDRHRV